MRDRSSLSPFTRSGSSNLRLPEQGTQRIQVTYASAALFKVLRTTPALGRLFTDEDGRPGFMSMKWQIPVLLSHGFWISRFGADPNVVGRILTDVNGNPREVVGVLPEGFIFPHADIQMWMLMEPAKTSRNIARDFSWDAVARMRPGVTPASAQVELAYVLRQIPDVDDDVSKARITPVVKPLKSAVIGDVAQVIWLLFGGMALLLLVACANAGGLFLVRAEHRAHEMAVRRSLGAHGPHLARLFVIEALMLTSTAATIGVLSAAGILSAVRALAPFELPRSSEIKLDGVAILFAATVAVMMAAFYGLLSVRRQGQSLTVGLLGGGRSASPRHGGFRGADALIVMQVALALTLMAGSALMVKTYRNLSQRELGFSPGDVLTVEIGLPSRKARQHVRIYHDVVERIRVLPQVETASAASFVPLTASEDVYPVEAGTTPVPFKFFVPGYFQTMATPILEGERFASAEHVRGPHPVLVSAALARRLYPGESAVGKTVQRLNDDGSVVEMTRGPIPPFTIVGVVANVREETLRASPTEIVYIPVIDPVVEQSIVPTTMRLVVRARVPLISLAAAVRTAVTNVDPDLSVGRIETMNTIVGAARAREAFVGTLLLVAAAVSLFLGVIGIYGTVAHVTRRRTREIGIRLALGASRAEVIRMVTAGSVRAVIVGSILGLVVSFVAVRMLGSLLFGVDAHKPMLFLAVTGCLIAAAGAAAFLAARHAAGVAPVVALRSE